MKITKESIKSLNPCDDRYRNYLKFYGKKEFTVRQFMELKNITHNDKMWVAFRLMPRENIRLAAAGIAESVLHLYEAVYPNDDRPRKAIESARKGHTSAAYSAAYAAYAYAAAYDAYAAYDAAYAAYDAAYAAYDAAYDAAYAAYSAAYSAANASYSAAYYAAYDAANAAYDAAPAKVAAQEKAIRTIILRYWK